MPPITKLPSRQTKPLRKMNIRFWKDHKLVPHDDPNLNLSDAVTLDFEFQKTKQRFQSITQYKSNHPKFCPVKAVTA